MLKILSDTTPYIDFADEIARDPDFCQPIYTSPEEWRASLLEAPHKSNNLVLGCFEGETPLGLFIFLVEEGESYLELLTGLSRSGQAYGELLDYLKNRYPGWQADFVYNPGNHLLHRQLQAAHAAFDPEQQKMVLTKDVPYHGPRQAELYSPQYRDQYLAIHQNHLYWTAEKVLGAPQQFRTVLAIEQGQVVGYIDITHCYEENEPYDVFVKEEFRRRGYARAMLARAIQLNRPKKMMLLVDVNNTASIPLYESMGFEKVPGQNNITAHVSL